MSPSWPSTIVALGFLAQVSFALWLASENDFDQIWGGVATIVGVIVGSIPSFFFKSQADKAQAVTAERTTKMERAMRRAEELAGIANKSDVENLKQAHPEIFGLST